MTLNWFVATQPGGTIQEVAADCSAQSNGQYAIKVNLLPTVATEQREHSSGGLRRRTRGST